MLFHRLACHHDRFKASYCGAVHGIVSYRGASCFPRITIQGSLLHTMWQHQSMWNSMLTWTHVGLGGTTNLASASLRHASDSLQALLLHSHDNTVTAGFHSCLLASLYFVHTPCCCIFMTTPSQPAAAAEQEYADLNDVETALRQKIAQTESLKNAVGDFPLDSSRPDL
eukprot:1149413-Pelagomonas_calceolata.AAC.18